MESREGFYQDERLIDELDSKEILTILESKAWEILDQKISSAETNNDNQEEPQIQKTGDNTAGVDAFADLKFDEKIKRILDVGGGKFDCCTKFMKKCNIELLVWDPYNRPSEHNIQVQKAVLENKVDAATSMSVLNVIAEPKVRLAHIATLKDALIMNGVAYFKVWPGEGVLRGSYKSTINSYGHPGFQANSYADRFLREVQMVFGIENVEIHKTIPNLIVATKKSEKTSSLEDIVKIQELAKKDVWRFSRKKVLISFFDSTASATPSEKKSEALQKNSATRPKEASATS